MLKPHKLAPGPTSTSCVTCKRRHKKCDQRRPNCERCEKGDFECLGYNHKERGVTLLPAAPHRQRPLLPKPDVHQSTNSVASTLSSSGDVVESVSQRSGRSISHSTPPSRLPPVPSEDDQDANPAEYAGGDKRYPESRELTAHPLAKGTLTLSQSLQSLLARYTRVPYVPYRPSKTLLHSSNLEDYVMSYWDHTIDSIYFRPVQMQANSIRSQVVSRVRASDLARWIMFIHARISESFIQGDTSQNQTYHLWINQTDQVLGSTSTWNHNMCFGDWLQLLFLKTIVAHSSDVYQILRYATPIFIQMVYSNPTLWPTGCDPTCIPLANAIASSLYPFSYFVLLDATAAMAFGLPQQVEYDSTFDSPPTSFPGYAHCTPIEFQVVLVEVNACRDKSPNARNWKEIEHKLVTWQARPSKYEVDWESWMAIAWFTVQEVWRHALLAYLYMSVCGLSSDDRRVQSSARQLLQLFGTIKKQESPNGKASFFVQYLMAGICARSETHRSIVRGKLANKSETMFWPLRAADFVLVLDDLWHGAAANGRPIKWADYVRSREKVLPVTL